MIRFLSLLVAALLWGAAPAHALTIGLNGSAGPQVDARAFGVKCDGTTNDNTAFSAAYDALTGTGGTIYVPNTGSACMINADVGVESNVTLQCAPGATLKATSGGSFSQGMFSWYTSKTDTGVEGCIFDLNSRAITALWVSGNRFEIRGNKFVSGATSNGSSWSMAYFAGQGEVVGNTATCANTSGAKDIGLQGNGGNSASGQVVSANVATNCDTAGLSWSNNATLTGNWASSTSTTTAAIGIQLVTAARAVGNWVEVAGSTAVGFEVGAYSAADDNYITTTGASSIGVSLTGASGGAKGNYIVATGTTNTGFKATGGDNVIIGNKYLGQAATGGTEAEVAFDVRTSGVRIIGNLSNFSNGSGVDESNWHVKVADQQTRIIGNSFLNGKYGVAPDNSAVITAINAYVQGNEIWGLGGTSSIAVVAITGWIVDGNYLAWNEGTSISIGDGRGTKKAVCVHAHIVGNRMHSVDTTGQGVVFANVGKLCDSGTKEGESCTNDNTTDCPSATACPNCCDTTAYANIPISGNEFLFTVATGGVIDIANAISASTSTTVNNVTIDGSTFDLAASGTAIKFPSSNQSLVTGVTIGDFSVSSGYTGTTLPISNLTAAQANLTSYPQQIADLAAANCVVSTAVSFWNGASSTQPQPACLGTTYLRGVLGFDAGSDETVYTDLILPEKWTGWLFADVWWGTSDTTSHNVVWGITGYCSAAGENFDPSFSSTANTVTSANVATTANYYSKATITLSNASNNPINTCAPGEVFVLKLYRDADNGSDTVNADANLWRVVLRQW